LTQFAQGMPNTRHSALRREARTLIALGTSVVMLVFLAGVVDWQESLRILGNGVAPWLLVPFCLVAVVIVGLYGWRWRLLLEHQLSMRAGLVASLLCLGGNMFLPARGGDLVRVHYSHKASVMPHSEVLSRLLLEKVVDLLTIAVVGLIAAWLLRHSIAPSSASLLIGMTGTAFAAGLVAVLMVRLVGERLFGWLRPLFRLLRKHEHLERHVAHMVRDAAQRLTLPNLLGPLLLTMALWLLAYAPSYVLAAGFVGVTLSYQESLLILFAGALGLMVPAAPSGIGTFHVSVVSAFLLLGRSAVEGLLVATAVHLLFFLAYAVPAAILFSQWRLASRPLTQES
jgi:glycosyltransferase 2 family protein